MPKIICRYCGWSEKAHAFHDASLVEAQALLAKIKEPEVKKDGRVTSLLKCPSFDAEQIKANQDDPLD